MRRRMLSVLTMMPLVLLLGSLLAACGEAEEQIVAPTTEQGKAPPAAIDGKSLL